MSIPFQSQGTYGHHPGFQITHHVVPTVPQLLLRSNESGPKVQSDETLQKRSGECTPLAQMNWLFVGDISHDESLSLDFQNRPVIPGEDRCLEPLKAFSWNIWGGSNTYSLGIWMSKIFICSSSKSPRDFKGIKWSVFKCCLAISRFFLMVSKRPQIYQKFRHTPTQIQTVCTNIPCYYYHRIRVHLPT